MKEAKTIILLLIASLSLFATPAHAGRCEGSAYCSVCTNCSRCAYCGAGGTCGVCAGTSAGRAPSQSYSAPTYTPPSYTHDSPSSTSSKPKSKPKTGLRRGLSGAKVARWQRFLKSKGFFTGEIRGNYGVLTERATANFQASNGLNVNGVADTTTISAARENGYSDWISAKTDDSCCAGVARTLTGERFVQTRRGVLSPAQIAAISDSDLRYAINEMYARYGLPFKDAAVQKEFCQRVWYHPRTERTASQVNALMSAIEKTNLKTLGQERLRRNHARQ